jgi:hypothetical protein
MTPDLVEIFEAVDVIDRWAREPNDEDETFYVNLQYRREKSAAFAELRRHFRTARSNPEEFERQKAEYRKRSAIADYFRVAAYTRRLR